jgi:hypothetical protein
MAFHQMRFPDNIVAARQARAGGLFGPRLR